METDTDDLASPEAPEDVDSDETVENVENVRDVWSGDGQDDIAGVGETEGEGEEARTGGAVASNSTGSSIATQIRRRFLVHTNMVAGAGQVRVRVRLVIDIARQRKEERPGGQRAEK